MSRSFSAVVLVIISGLLPVRAQSPTPSPSPTSIGEKLLEHHWTVDERKSPIDDSLTVVFSLLGQHETESAPGTEIALMLIRYKEHKWDVIVHAAGGYLGYGRPSVILRWDQAKAEKALWDDSTGNVSAFAPSPKAFVSQVMKSTKLVVRMFPKFTGEETILFNVAGLADEINKYPEIANSLRGK